MLSGSCVGGVYLHKIDKLALKVEVVRFFWLAKQKYWAYIYMIDKLWVEVVSFFWLAKRVYGRALLRQALQDAHLEVEI